MHVFVFKVKRQTAIYLNASSVTKNDFTNNKLKMRCLTEPHYKQFIIEFRLKFPFAIEWDGHAAVSLALMVRILKQTLLQSDHCCYTNKNTELESNAESHYRPKSSRVKKNTRPRPRISFLRYVCVYWHKYYCIGFDPNNANLFESDYAYILQRLKITQTQHRTENSSSSSTRMLDSVRRWCIQKVSHHCTSQSWIYFYSRFIRNLCDQL